ncbi:MAG TPA: hypothetical protein VKH19_07330 [Gemmatimonadaceae bacterium]|nr:hypothetical protein [Gemmatimonadaceae bacterium]
MRADSAQERWEGWWDVGDESYYARSIRADGSDQWYRFADERCDAPEGRADTRVLILRRPGVRRASSARMAVIGRANGGTMLVGSLRRRARSSDVELGGSR